MKFSLVVTNAEGKNLIFVTEGLQAFSLDKAIQSVHQGEVPGAYIVQRKTGLYIRTTKNVPKNEQLESLAVTAQELLNYIHAAPHAKSTPAIGRYVELYIASLAEGQEFIEPVDYPKVLTAAVKEKLVPQRANIFAAAEAFEIDSYLLGAIIINEIAKLSPFEPIFDALGAEFFGVNTSVGIAQVKIDTANDLIRKGVYNPDPTDLLLPYKKRARLGRMHLFTYLIQPKHNIFFAAAFLRSIIQYWAPTIVLTNRPEIMGTLYSKGYGQPKPNPEASPGGAQVANEFYPLAKQWLQEL